MSTHHGILIHLVFSTKLRIKVLKDEWRDDLFAYMNGTLQETKTMLLKSGGIEDHVHLLLKIHPSYAFSETVKHLKANSSRWINEQDFVHGHFEWQRGYGAFSVSQSMANKVKQYIARQREHHANESFESEYMKALTNHGIEFDPRFVFETEHSS